MESHEFGGQYLKAQSALDWELSDILGQIEACRSRADHQRDARLGGQHQQHYNGVYAELARELGRFADVPCIPLRVEYEQLEKTEAASSAHATSLMAR